MIIRNKVLKRYILCATLLVVAVLAVYIIWENSALVLTQITVTSEKLPKGFNGYKVAQVSDLHNAEMGKGNSNLIKMLKSAEPDIIALTGDIFDSRRTDVDVSINFAAEAAKIAPCYYITGNHEERDDEALDKLLCGLESAGVTILRNDSLTLECSGDSITLLGVDDPTFTYDSDSSTDLGKILDNELYNIVPHDDTFKLLLSHRPEYIDVYKEYSIDLVLAGHAHGGQIRIPFIGGLITPGQGLFPKYTSGLYTAGSTNMVVSRGIGNSLFPFRLNNRPEVVFVTLRSTDQ